MIYIKSNAEIELIRESCLLVSATLSEVATFLRPGLTTLEVDKLAEDFIRSHGATPSFKNYKGYPFATCISVNDAVVHGFPGSHVLKSGDIISVDVGAYKNGFHGDSAYTFAIGEISTDIADLLTRTRASLYRGIEMAIVNNRIGDISFAIQESTEKRWKYGVVRELVGHGIGKHLHEDPQVPNYGKKGMGSKLKENMVIAIEPMVNLGVKEVSTDEDGWTIRTKDGNPSAHYEHTICIKKKQADILSSFDQTIINEKANINLFSDY